MIKYLDLKRINDLHDGELRKAVNRVMDSGWFLKGEATREFEQHYASYIGTKYCVIAQSMYEMWLPTRSTGPSHGIFCTPVTRNL